MRLDLGLGSIDGSVTLLLVGDLVGGAQISFGDVKHGGFDEQNGLPWRSRAALWPQLQQA